MTEQAAAEVTVEEGVAVLRVPGRLTMRVAPQLKGIIDRTVAGGAPRLVVDLAETEFIDSSGLGALIGGLKVARQAGGDLRIANAGAQVLTVLGLTNLDRILRPHPSVQDARHGW